MAYPVEFAPEPIQQLKRRAEALGYADFWYSPEYGLYGHMPNAHMEDDRVSITDGMLRTAEVKAAKGDDRLTLGRHLYECHKRNIVDFRLAITERDGVMYFYMHPLGRDGETLDFYVVGNLLIPAAVDGVVSDLFAAMKADCDQFMATPGLSRCPKCQGDLLGFMFDARWYVAIDGGMGVDTPDGPGEAWVLGIQTCPECGHQWEVEG